MAAINAVARSNNLIIKFPYKLAELPKGVIAAKGVTTYVAFVRDLFSGSIPTPVLTGSGSEGPHCVSQAQRPPLRSSGIISASASVQLVPSMLLSNTRSSVKNGRISISYTSHRPYHGGRMGQWYQPICDPSGTWVAGAGGYIELPPTLDVVQEPLVIAAAGFMYCVEFFADKIPGVDSGWDGLHTFIRIPAGAMLAAGAVGDVTPALSVAAGILGGGVAAASHATKASSRLMINTSPEPVTNWTASVAEDVAVFAGLWAALYHPLWFLAAFVPVLGAGDLAAAKNTSYARSYGSQSSRLVQI